MPYLETAQQWLTQSTLLLQARPSTTRITTKYTILPPPTPSSKPRKTKTSPKDPSSTTTTPAPSTEASQAPEPIRARLTLKTYDPVSGATLKYETTKAAEVSRLIQILGRLARPMAGLPEVKEDVSMGEAGEGEGVVGAVAEILKPAQAASGTNGGGGGGKKKKKGKK